MQRTSSDLRLNPHLHLIALDGAYAEPGAELVWHALGHLKTSEVGVVLERSRRRIEKHLRRRRLLVEDDGAEADAEGDADPESKLAASAVSGQAPPAGPQWKHGLQPLEAHALAYDKPLRCLARWVHLACRDARRRPRPGGREALLRYVLRSPIAEERVEHRPHGLVRITLKKAYADGTVAVDMNRLSLLCRLATSVPPPRFHPVRYAGVLASASPWRSCIAPKPPPEAAAATGESETPMGAGGYRPWAELLARTFGVDVLACAKCQGRMKLLAMVKSASIARYLAAVGEATEVPRRSTNCGPPYWKSRVLRRAGDRRRGRVSQRQGRRGAVGAERAEAAVCSGLRAFPPDRREGSAPEPEQRRAGP